MSRLPNSSRSSRSSAPASMRKRSRRGGGGAPPAVDVGARAVDVGGGVARERPEALGGDAQQLRVVGGDERADQAERERVGKRLVLLRVVALVVDERQLLEGQAVLAQAALEEGEGGGELARVGAVGGGGAVG